MNKDYKPENYNSVSPYLIVNDAQKLIEMLEVAFNAKVLRRYNGIDGSIMHAEVSIDDSIVMISDSSETFPATASIIHIYVPNVDEVYKKAINAGFQSYQEPKQQQDDPDRRGSFKDLSGNTWAVATQIN